MVMELLGQIGLVFGSCESPPLCGYQLPRVCVALYGLWKTQPEEGGWPVAWSLSDYSSVWLIPDLRVARPLDCSRPMPGTPFACMAICPVLIAYTGTDTDRHQLPAAGDLGPVLPILAEPR